MSSEKPALIEVKNLRMAYGEKVIMEDLNFKIESGEIFIIMGGSGCGKSTLLRHMIGLHLPAAGKVLYSGTSFWDADPDEQTRLTRRFGVLYQSGALWSSMTLAENIALPLEELTTLSSAAIAQLVSYKLALVGLAGYEDYLPQELSGGMQKRAALARAIALDPEILFFDEPGAGLDPLTSRHLDDLILQLRDTLGATVVIVTHELASILAIGSNSIMMDAAAKTIIAQGAPRKLLSESRDPRVQAFLRRDNLEKST